MLLEPKIIKVGPNTQIINSEPKSVTAFTEFQVEEIFFGLCLVSKYTEYEEEVLLTIQQTSGFTSTYCIIRCFSIPSSLCWLSLEAVLDFSWDSPSSPSQME